MKHEHLYRALRRVEIDAGCVLIPKADKSFKAHLRVPFSVPITVGETVEHAIQDHQWCSKYSTRGVSTTPDLKRANFYAQKDRIIARVSVRALEAFGIRAYVVKEHVHPKLIAVPEDDEVVLVYEGGFEFPKDIIDEVIRI